MDWKSSSERLAEALERARRHWQTRREPAGADDLAWALTPAYTITLSREAGASGPLIARTVGARLGWPVYDHELVQRIAEEMGLHSSLLASVDEKRVGWLRECLEAFSTTATVSKEAYVRRLVEILLSLAAHGDCIILGRGAAMVLPAATTLRVRLVGPLQARIAAIEQRFGIPRAEAERWVEKTDQERVRFVLDHFHKDPRDPQHHDLVLNSSRFAPMECADLIIEALQRLRGRTTVAKPATPPAEKQEAVVAVS